MELIKKYVALTKPGIIRGNVMTATGGFLLAADGHIDVWLYAATMAAIGLIIGSACMLNNYIDRGIDKKMARTKKRALVTGEVSVQNALLFGSALGALGLALLVLFVNMLTVLLGVIAFSFYVVLYGIAKRRSPLGTLVGSVPGAMSVTAGYTAVTDRFDSGALWLFLILAFWQMPHFYAIATYRLKEYRAAGLPVLPAVRGIEATKRYVVAYMLFFLVACGGLYTSGYTGVSYLVVMVAVGLWWLSVGYRGFKMQDSVKWGRQVFGASLVVLTTFSIMISLNAWLP